MSGRRRGAARRSTDSDASQDGGAQNEARDRQPASRAKGERRPGLGRFFWIYFAFMLAVLIPLNIVCLQQQPDMQGPGESTERQPGAILESIEAEHDPYSTDPPTSGPRVSELAPYGFHETTIPDEVQVANLEAGFVIVHFNPAGGAILESEMRQLAAEFESYNVIVHPDPNLAETQVALTAWGRIQLQEAYDKDQVYDFILLFVRDDPTALPASTGTR